MRSGLVDRLTQTAAGQVRTQDRTTIIGHECKEERPARYIPAWIVRRRFVLITLVGLAALDPPYIAAKFLRSRSPSDWLFSGWNWLAKTRLKAIAEQNGPP